MQTSFSNKLSSKKSIGTIIAATLCLAGFTLAGCSDPEKEAVQQTAEKYQSALVKLQTQDILVNQQLQEVVKYIKADQGGDGWLFVFFAGCATTKESRIPKEIRQELTNISKMKFTRPRINGDTATLQIIKADGTTSILNLVKEKSEWKIIRDDNCFLLKDFATQFEIIIKEQQSAPKEKFPGLFENISTKVVEKINAEKQP